MSANQQALIAVEDKTVKGQITFGASSGAVGQQNNWVVPAGVTSISVVCVAMGTYEGGGCLRYVNNIAVTPGETLNAYFLSNDGARFRRGSTSLCYAPVYAQRGAGIGTGGNGGYSGDASPGASSGGGGAGGYSGNGGQGSARINNAPAGSGSGGGGGGGGGNASGGGAGGGGVGLLGEGASGSGGVGGAGTPTGGGGGSGGGAGSNGTPVTNPSAGGNYGGGSGLGGDAGVRIIWPGNLRQFPSTRTANE